MNDYKNLDLSLEDHTAVITLKRPEMMNALNRELTQEFHQVIETIGHKFPQIRAVILTGQGRGICQGWLLRVLKTEEILLSEDVPEREYRNWLPL